MEQRIVIDEHGDIEILVKDHRFLVSTAKMSTISPEFRQLFSAGSRPLTKTIELPDEDPEAFHRICQSAHGFLIPQVDISTDTLVKMADALQRYNISPTSNIRATVVFCFIVQTLKPGTMSTSKLLKLLQVAKTLGSSRFKRLLEDAFLLRPLRTEELPLKEDIEHQSTDCIILLGASPGPTA